MTAEQERSAIVAWLRGNQTGLDKSSHGYAKFGDYLAAAQAQSAAKRDGQLADAIERGDHET